MNLREWRSRVAWPALAAGGGSDCGRQVLRHRGLPLRLLRGTLDGVAARVLEHGVSSAPRWIEVMPCMPSWKQHASGITRE